MNNGLELVLLALPILYLFTFFILLRLENKSSWAQETGPCDRRKPLGHPLGPWDLPEDAPRDLPGTPRRHPWTTQTTISQQICSASSSWMVHLDPFIAMHWWEQSQLFPPVMGCRTSFSLMPRPQVHQLYIYIYIYIWQCLVCCFDESPPETICTPTLFLTSLEYMHAGMRPTERSKACSEGSDEGRDCKLHITQSKISTQTQTKNFTQHKLKPTTVRNTESKLHMTQTKTAHNKQMQSWNAALGMAVLSLFLTTQQTRCCHMYIYEYIYIYIYE